MDTHFDHGTSPADIPANRHLVEELSYRGLISAEARAFALSYLNPPKAWAVRTARLLLILGSALVVAGLLYFFAFNWTKIPASSKLGALELAIALSIAGAYFAGPKTSIGKVSLTSASALVGVLIAVFGQIYQTGADAYTLFMVWAALIFPWTILGKFTPLWALWLTVMNLFLGLCWTQSVAETYDATMYVLPILAVFNSICLALREYLVAARFVWLDSHWSRFILVVLILCLALIPSIAFVVDPDKSPNAIKIGALLSVVIHVGFYHLYRSKMRDIWCLAATILSLCIIAESVFIKITGEMNQNFSGITLFVMGCLTLALFTGAVIKLRRIVAETEI